MLVAADESVERALFDGEVDADVEVADDDGMIDVGELVVQYLCLAVFPPPDGRGDADGRFAVEPGETIYDASIDGDLGV